MSAPPADVPVPSNISTWPQRVVYFLPLILPLVAVQPPKPPIKLVVLNPGNKDATPAGTITLAVASSQREQFQTAIGPTTLALTRKIEVHK